MANVFPLSVRQIDENGVENVKTDASNSVSVQMEGHTERRTVMSFHNVTYEVGIPKSPFGACRSKDNKTILTNIKWVVWIQIYALTILIMQFHSFKSSYNYFQVYE